MDEDHERRREDPFASAITRIGERVAALEARAGAEIGALKNDTETIRRSIHEFTNQMQMFIATSSTNQTLLGEHMKMCDARSRRLEKIGFTALSMLIAVLGLLLKNHFFP